MVYYETENEFFRDASRGTFEVCECVEEGGSVCVCVCVCVQRLAVIFV